MKKEIVAVLYNFRSVYNTAACFRTADGAGVRKLYLVGTTPAPFDRFGRARKDFAKVALSAEKSVTYEKTDDAFALIESLRAEGFEVVAIEQDKRAEDLFLFVKKNKKSRLALIFGNEVEGVDLEILKKCDRILEIPMRGGKESLNVAVAFGVAIYTLNR